MLFLAALLILVNGCQIYTGNMDKPPTRWVMVLDADTGVPIEGVALMYFHTKKPYFIASTVVASRRTYVSGPDGRAYVPRNEHLQAAGGYVIDVFRHPYPSYKDTEVYYVRTLDSHMKLLDKRLNQEKKLNGLTFPRSTRRLRLSVRFRGSHQESGGARVTVVWRAERMSIFPITPLVRRVQALVLQTFDVSEEEAEDYAAMMVSLAEDHGGSDKAATLDWNYALGRIGRGQKMAMTFQR